MLINFKHCATRNIHVPYILSAVNFLTPFSYCNLGLGILKYFPIKICAQVNYKMSYSIWSSEDSIGTVLYTRLVLLK